MKRLLAIDPGSEKSAVLGFDLVAFRPIMTHRITNQQVLDGMRDWRDQYQVCCVEFSRSYTMARESGPRFFPNEVLVTARWVGRFEQAWGRDETFSTLDRRHIKLMLCDTSRVGDSIIRHELISRFAPTEKQAIGTKAEPGPLYYVKGDLWAALALAVVFGLIQKKEEEAYFPTTRPGSIRF